MRNQEIAKGLRLIAEGFTTLAVAYEKSPEITGVDMSKEGDKTVVSNVIPMTQKVVKQEVVEPVKEVKQEPKKEEVKEAQPVAVGTFPTEEELNALSYNDLKIKAKELGVKAVGSKKVIIENILASVGNVDAIPEEPSKEEDFTEQEIDNSVEENQPEEDTLVEIDETEEEPEDEPTLYDQVVADLEGYEDEELANILSDIGISPKGRRQALLAKIVQAIEDGQLVWEDEESETVQEEATEPSKDVEPEEDREVVEEDFVGTEARKHACWEECEEIEKAFDKGELEPKKVLNFLKEYYNNKYVSAGVNEDLNEYIAIQCDLIDDEGTKHEMSDPYYIGDDVFCCGEKLKELKDDLFCEKCGVTYTNE